MTALRRRQPATVATAPTAQDTQDLLALARALRDRAQYLLIRPGELRARARRQLAELRARQLRDFRTEPPADPGDPGRLDPGRRDPGQTELLATLWMLRRATAIRAGLRPRIDALIDEIEELIPLAGRAASPARMFFAPRHSRDAAQVAAAHLRRFMLSLSTLRLADDIRRSRIQLDLWQPDAPFLWDDYLADTASYQALLADLTGGHCE
ncbi:MAG TPA: hypothetical protein VHH34_06430 [Pseudonocardiaceae bacterium]|nr:hypothetical protein [Pseudonocardiaceae bacterium]